MSGGGEMAVSGTRLQIVHAARLVIGDAVIAGSGKSILAASLASHLEPTLKVIFDSGIIAPAPDIAPTSVSDPRIESAGSIVSMGSVLGPLLASGRVFTGIIGAAQIDSLCQINSSYVKDRGGRMRRLPGAGGATAIARGVKRLVILLDHEARRFPTISDYVSSTPFPGRGVPNDVYCPSSCCEVWIVTQSCVLKATSQDPVIRLHGLMPGATSHDVRTTVPFAVLPLHEMMMDDATEAELRAFDGLFGFGGEKWDRLGRTSSRIFR